MHFCFAISIICGMIRESMTLKQRWSNSGILQYRRPIRMKSAKMNVFERGGPHIRYQYEYQFILPCPSERFRPSSTEPGGAPIWLCNADNWFGCAHTNLFDVMHSIIFFVYVLLNDIDGEGHLLGVSPHRLDRSWFCSTVSFTVLVSFIFSNCTCYPAVICGVSGMQVTPHKYDEPVALAAQTQKPMSIKKTHVDVCMVSIRTIGINTVTRFDWP